MSIPHRLLIGLLVVVFGLTAVPVGADAGQAGPAEVETLKQELAHLKQQLGTRRADNEELITYLRVAARSYESLEGKDGAKLRAQILELLRKGLRVWRVKHDENVRLPVNIEAAKLLGTLAPKLEKKQKTQLARTVERMLEQLPKARYTVEDEHIEALAELLGRIGQERSIHFLKREYLRTEQKLVPYIIAAMKALVLFEDVAPRVRFDLVDHAQRRYGPLETAAQTSSTSAVIRSKKETWDRIRTHVIGMMQKLARTPLNEKQQALNTVHEFEVWLRDNDDPRQAPWTLPEPKPTATTR